MLPGLARFLYTVAWYLATPLVLSHLLWRSRRQPDYRRGIAQRFGFHASRPGSTPLIWIHAVSVGETRAAQPLVRALLQRYPRHRLLLTHMTPTGRDTGSELFQAEIGAGRLAQALLPYDYPFAMRRFLTAWRPTLGILMETELWPNLVAVAREREVPLALVNARLSARSLAKGRRWSWLMRPALAGLELVLAQTQVDAQRIAAMGRPEVSVVGNLKFDVAPAAGLEPLGHSWRLALLGREKGLHRPAVLAASTRDGEEALLLDAWCEWRRRTEGQEPQDTPWPPLLVIVPRHPHRFDEVAALVRQAGLRLVRRSGWRERGPQPGDRAAEVLLGDSMGEMFAYYSLADAAIIGGSLLPFGGQNLIEACAAGVPVVVGPWMFNFEAATEQAIAEDAAVRAPDAPSALREALRIVSNPVTGQTMAEHALTFAERHRGATSRTVSALASLIQRPGRQSR